MYHFRAPFVLDISKLDPKDANQRALTNAQQPRMDGFVSYERCEYLSCHAAELSYTFEIEKQINCTAVSNHKIHVTLTLTLFYSWLNKLPIW